MSIQDTKVTSMVVHIHHRIWALVVVVSAVSLLAYSQFASAASTRAPEMQRLVTVYDQGEEKTFTTDKASVGAALRAEGIQIEAFDAVEPRADTIFVAKNYVVNIYRARSVVVNDGVHKLQVLTAEQSPRRILEQAGLKLYDEDRTQFSLASSPLADGGAGLQLRVDRATVFSFSLYGKTFEARSQAETVGAMLKDKGIVLGPQDGQSVAGDAKLVDGMSIRVWRNGKQTMTQEEVIAKPIEEVKDADREYGTREVRTPGVDGKKNVTYEIDMRDGQEVSRRIIASVTTQEPTKEIVVVGTRFKGAYTSPSENETITWNFLIGQGFSRNQTAGIMGNIKQEHGFNTTGDGLVQWTGSRKAALLAMPDPYNINTQLSFLMIELNGGYAGVRDAIKASSSVDEAVIIFQNRFERCGVCAESRRIQYAYDILASH